MAHRNSNLSEIVLNVTINGLKTFKDDFKTDEFYLNDTPWYIRFSKVKEGKTNYLTIHLHSNFKHNSDKTHIDATFNAMLLSSKASVNSHQDRIYLDAFCTDNPCWGFDTFIAWKQLINPINGYIVDDHCKFQIRVKATKVLNADNNDLLQFEDHGENGYGSQRKFRLTITNFQNTVGVCSPNINFDGSAWRVAVSEIAAKIVFTICKTGGENSCCLTCKIKLVPSDPKIQPITKEIKDLEFPLVGSYDKWELIDWDDLIDPRKKFIQDDDSFVIEVELKAKQGNSAPKKRRSNARESGAIFSSCPICSEDLKGQPISSVKPCNHMFCTGCVRRAPRCPMCNGVVQSVLSYVATE